MARSLSQSSSPAVLIQARGPSDNPLGIGFCSASPCLFASPRRISLRDNLLSDDVEAQPSLSAWCLAG